MNNKKANNALTDCQHLAHDIKTYYNVNESIFWRVHDFTEVHFYS